MMAIVRSAGAIHAKSLCLVTLALTCIHVKAGLVARWTFNESGGAIAHDSAGAFDGTLNGGAAFVAGGVSGNALSLDRTSNSFVNMGTSFPDLASGDFSIAVWIRTTTTEADSIFVARHEAGTLNGYLLALNTSSTYGQPNKAWFSASTLARGEAISTTTVNDGHWHQIVAVYKAGDTHAIYVDGAPAEQIKPSAPIGPNAAPFLIGGISFDGMPRGLFTGLVDDAQVYDHALSSSEVQLLFLRPGWTPGARIAVMNPSFELDPMPPFPGYGPITGWAPGGGIETSYGINEFGMPFAGHAVIPDGTKVAFIQHNGTLSQNIPGFRIGGQYWLTFRENARHGCCGGTGSLAVSVGAETIVALHPVTPVGTMNPYRHIGSQVFTAGEDTLTLTFAKDGEGDITVLIDLVEIVEVPPKTPPGIMEQPKSQRADPGESVTLTGSAVGSTPMFYQWWFNGAKLDGETNETLTLDPVSPQHAGIYWFEVSNVAGWARSSDAYLRVRADVPVVLNPSFEQDPVPPFPGYGTITGWIPNTEIGSSYGINPMNGAFADNGAVPHGTKVAFLQHNGLLAQTVSGFRVGRQYWLSYRENARQNCCGERVATLSVFVGNARVVPEHSVEIVGDINPFRLVTSQPFTATETDLTIVFEKRGTGDATALIDDVRIFPRDNFKLGITQEIGSVPVIRIDGAPADTVSLEYKVSLLPGVSWEPWTDLPVIDWSAVTPDLSAPAAGHRFYRAHVPQ